jgi:hypothetical protein
MDQQKVKECTIFDREVILSSHKKNLQWEIDKTKGWDQGAAMQHIDKLLNGTYSFLLEHLLVKDIKFPKFKKIKK